MITAMYLFVRLYCSSVMQQNVHVFPDFFALVVTLWVLCKSHFKLRSTYSKDLDHFPLTYLVIHYILRLKLIVLFYQLSVFRNSVINYIEISLSVSRHKEEYFVVF